MQSFNILPFIKSGFWAGLTPCAFLNIVFFAFVFLYLPLTRKKKDLAGVVFILSIFGTYYFLELGVFEAFRQSEIFEILVRGFYLLSGVVLVILGSMSLYDWYFLKRYRSDEKILLKFPGTVNSPEKNNLAHLARLLIFPGISGFLMALLSSHCRGYLTLSSILSLVIDGQMKVKTVVYNSLYNIMSVLPLILVFCLLKSGMFQKIASSNIARAKIMSSGVLLGLGFGLLFMFSR